MSRAHDVADGTPPPSAASRTDHHAPRVLLAVVITVLGGSCAAVMNTVNGRLGEAGTGPVVAATISYAVTLVGAALLFVVRRRVRVSWQMVRTQGSWWWFAVGLLSVPIVVGFAWGIPLIGVALAVVCTVAGQVVASLTLDAMGVGARVATGLTPRRAGAAVLALVGLVVASFGSGGGIQDGRALLTAGVLFLVGAVSVGAQAGSGRIMARVEDPFVAAMTTSTGGFVGLCVIVAVQLGTGAMAGLTLPSQWWMYLGGLFGLVVGIAGAFGVRHLGTFVLTMTVLGGQMVTALTVDTFSPVGVHGLTLVATVVVVAAALLVIERPRATPSTTQPSRTGPADQRENAA